MSGLDLREVQDVTDDRKQGFGGLAGSVGELPLHRIQPTVQQKGSHSDDPMDRGSKFVAHVGEEFTLGLAGRLSPGLGLLPLHQLLLQRLGAMPHLHLQLIPMPFQHLIRCQD